MAALLACLVLAGCGDSDSTDSAQAAFEDSEAVPVGRSLLIRLPPNTQSAEQRRALAYIMGGKWVQNGLFIPADQVAADCRAELLSEEACASRP